MATWWTAAAGDSQAGRWPVGETVEDVDVETPRGDPPWSVFEGSFKCTLNWRVHDSQTGGPREIDDLSRLLILAGSG